MSRKRNTLFAMLIATSFAAALATTVALADGVTGVAVQPLTPEPGETITVKGDLLGPSSEVEVRLVGMGEDIDLGEIQTDEEGDFTAQFQLPNDLTPGTYQVKAIGEKTATTQMTVLGGGAVDSQGGGELAPVLRERPLGESLVLVALFGVVAALGLFLARITRPETAP